ncbi:MAG: fibronectin type III domain-containing protein [Candidatus Hydrothermia bacterium]
MKKIIFFLPIAFLLILASCMQEIGDITPTNLTITAVNETQVKLTWEAPVDEVDGFIIEFYNENNSLVFADTIAPTIYSKTYDPDGYVGTYKLYGYKGDSVSSPVSVSTIPTKFPTLNLTIYELDQAGNSGLGLGNAGNWAPTSYGCSQQGAPDVVDFYYTDGMQGSTGLFQYLASADVIATSWEESNVGNNTTGWRNNFIEKTSPQNGIIPSTTVKRDLAVQNGVYSFKVARGSDYYYGVLELGSVSNTQTTIKSIKIQNIPNFRVIGR